MRTPTRITTIVSAGVIAAAGTAAVASAAGQGSPNCDGTGQRSGQQAGQRPGMHGQGMRTQQRSAQRGRAVQRGRSMRRARQHTHALPTRTNASPLSPTEAAAVTYMREEEKLARDVYTKLAATSGNPVFTRIASSEQRHMDAMGRIITRYGLTDPAKGEAAGQFQNQDLQRLYDELVAKGSASPAAAVQVGLSIEKLDINDLNAREATSKHSDVRWVFQQLERGSNNHLRAFTIQNS